jgi:hypothetical protein
MTANQSKKEDKACFAEAIAASRLRCKDRLIAVVKQKAGVVNAQDAEGDSTLLVLQFPAKRQICY